MDLSKVSNTEILFRLERLTLTERKITHLILCHINEVAARMLYAELGYESLHEYLVKHLKYADDAAYRRIRAANVLKQVPEVADKLESGTLNLTQLTHVQQCIRHEKKSGKTVSVDATAKILEQIENKNSYDTKKFLAVEFDIPIETRQILNPQRDNSVRAAFTLSEEQMEIINQTKDTLSHVVPDGDLAALFTHLAKQHLNRVHGKNKSKEISSGSKIAVTSTNDIEELKFSASSKDINNTDPSSSNPSSNLLAQSFSSKPKRSSIKITLRRSLFKNADHTCEYVCAKTGRKCPSRHQLQIDHRNPLALGGNNSSENLRVLCRHHNILEAKRWGLHKPNNK